MKTLLIVYHSMTGGALQMASATAGGARTEASLHVRLQRAEDTQVDDVLHADGIIFAAPENLAAMSGKMKDFFDRTYYSLLDRINGKPYATLICAGSDGRNAALQIDRIATGWRLRPIAEPIIVCTHAHTPQQILQPKSITAADLKPCEELGATLAAGLALGIF